uniref:Cysteine-rich venom protein n=1 Tax=Strigamia maritima TaxID=126957 RepID=T1JAR1_STRMM
MEALLRVLSSLFIFQFLFSVNEANCKYKNLSSTHTMCIYSAKVACKAIERGITPSDVKVIVDSHNTIRSQIAINKSASNMLKMEWDPELAEVAQRLVDQCKYQRDCFDCRVVERFFAVGQIIHRTRKTAELAKNLNDTSSEWKRIIQIWGKPKVKISESVRKSYVSKEAHNTYSQVIWAESQYVGCGFISFVNTNQVVKMYVCNYGPAGNMLEEPIYQSGAPCSACPTNSTCSSGLCS